MSLIKGRIAAPPILSESAELCRNAEVGFWERSIVSICVYGFLHLYISTGAENAEMWKCGKVLELAPEAGSSYRCPSLYFYTFCSAERGKAYKLASGVGL